MESIWSEQIEIPKRKPLKENISVHTVVIGAGMAGILTAYLLKKKGIDVVVVEAERIAGGQTKNTTAKITSQHGLLYDELIRKAGRGRAEMYAAANEDAIRMYEEIIREEKISCRFQRVPSYLYAVTGEGREKLKKEEKAAGMLGIAARFLNADEITELPFPIEGALCFENQALFQPLEFIRQLAKKIEIFENTKVLSVKKHMVITDKGEIRAENIVFAAHYPFLIFPGFYFLRMHQERSYVLALEGQKELGGMYYGIDGEKLSFRSAGNSLLLGGGGHRTGKKDWDESPCGCAKQAGCSYLRQIAEKYYSDAAEEAFWSAQDNMSHDKIPLIGKYSVFRPCWYVASGFNKWGMTSAMVSAMIICDEICERGGLYKNAFSPQRLLLRMGIGAFLIDAGESIMGLSRGLFSKKARRCTHMGCRLEWNPEEKSWDCPCHGSRFDEEGNLLNGPAKKNKKNY